MNKRQKRTGKKKPEQPAMRSRTIFLNEPPKKDTIMHKSIFEFLAFLGKAFFILLGTITVLIAVFGIAEAWSNPTDWHNHEVSEQISLETRCEFKGGVYENGICLPPNLTPSEERELQLYTAQKQAEIDRTFRGK
ncbi:hypothetical protein BKK47_11345 [Rodentibacter mrazii]|uniref:Uncharacterized protein n=1 Tax=Rodentibacter mrazii TaxID=1908257 RepID=A0A1V3IAN9_9PAST|nr:hypothetical protein [Rodentibacter mrazii]OOF37043.1 hypothetical protein BKK47_11345 [Rodentibacter mrazii]